MFGCNGTETDDTEDIVVVDEDGDGTPAADDCDDSDPTSYPGAIDVPEDGIDQDCDGADSEVEGPEPGTEYWSFGGDATVDTTAGTYAGTTWMRDAASGESEVLEAGTVLCQYDWLTTGTVAVTPAAACDDCDFVFTLATDTVSSKTGDFCAQWYSEDWDTLDEVFVLGYNPAFDDGLGLFPALMMYDDGSYAGTDPYWYGIPAGEDDTVSFDGTAFSWSFVAGTYAFYYYE